MFVCILLTVGLMFTGLLNFDNAAPNGELHDIIFLNVLLYSTEPLYDTHTIITTVIQLRRCSIELQGSGKSGMENTQVFLRCLKSWDGRLKGDRRPN